MAHTVCCFASDLWDTVPRDLDHLCFSPASSAVHYDVAPNRINASLISNCKYSFWRGWRGHSQVLEAFNNNFVCLLLDLVGQNFIGLIFRKFHFRPADLLKKQKKQEGILDRVPISCRSDASCWRMSVWGFVDPVNSGQSLQWPPTRQFR